MHKLMSCDAWHREAHSWSFIDELPRVVRKKLKQLALLMYLNVCFIAMHDFVSQNASCSHCFLCSVFSIFFSCRDENAKLSQDERRLRGDILESFNAIMLHP